MEFLALFAIFAVAAAQNMLFDPDLNEHWENFKRVFGKTYKGKEEVARRLIWEKQVYNVTQQNLRYDLGLVSYRTGINEFSDMEHEEFVRTFNGYVHQIQKPFNGSSWVPPSNVQLPSWVDWRAQGLVTGVKNQKQCGSCWAFSATGSLEGQHAKKTRQLISLSEQNLVDCSRGEGNKGCAGGWMGWAFEYIKKNNGIDTEASYPYTARDGHCQFKRYAVGAKVSGHVNIQSGNEWALQQAVATVGPIAVAIDSSHHGFMTYKNGIYYEPACSPQKLGHAVLVVGYGSEGGRDYWLVKNSWGTSWGMNGYIKMARNKNNNCGIASAATFPLV